MSQFTEIDQTRGSVAKNSIYLLNHGLPRLVVTWYYCTLAL